MRLTPLLLAILAGCPSTDDKDTGDTDPVIVDDTGCNHSCCGFVQEHRTEELTYSAEELVILAGEDNVVSEEECRARCEEAMTFYGDAVSCDGQAPTDDGGLVLTCGYDTVCEGRRPAGLARARLPGSGAARWLARAAHAEAASVPAFARLARELVEHGAPAALVDAARSAARDEVRHARVMGGLARAHGVTPPRARVRAVPNRALAAIALENAVEGCVNETWAAVVALHQAREAQDPRVAEAMAAIAVDEARHAELAHAVHVWVLPRLAPTERRRVVAARRAAVRSLATIAYPPVLGLPDAAAVRRLHAGMVARVWG
ncbi:MAG: ferritin-like domain-containing protein [Myxococcota bacterium]